MKYELIQKQKYLDLILDAVKKTTNNIYLATDPDREGEAIAWHVASILLEKNLLKIKKYPESFFLKSQKSYLSAVNKPRDISMHLVNAQQARRALDHLVDSIFLLFCGKNSVGTFQLVEFKALH